jgi:hypothetical protein
VNDEQLVTDAGVVRSVLARAHEGLVDRELLVEAIALCAVAGEHLLVVGPPGTAKSQAVRSVAQLLGGRYFEYLLGRFSEPSEIFGPVDLRRLREGVVEVSTDGMLPEADIAFLDEVFLGSTAILNTLLGLLNERVYRRGSTARRVPLRVCVGATNTLPEEPALAAFADRFLARVFVEPIPDALLEDLLRAGVGTAAQHLDPESGREPATDPTADGPASREGRRRPPGRPRRAARAGGHRDPQGAGGRPGDHRPARRPADAVDRCGRSAGRTPDRHRRRPVGAAADRADPRRPAHHSGPARRRDGRRPLGDPAARRRPPGPR